MTEDLDRLDTELREYGERWRATIPEPVAPDPRLFGSGSSREPGGRSGLVLGAAAAAVVTVVLAISFAARGPDRAPTPSSQTPTPTTSTEPGVVPWAPLDATHPTIPQVTIPASPDPAAAAAARPCRVDDLRVVHDIGGAAGTVVLTLTIRPASADVSCRLQGHPKVDFLDRGLPVDIPTVSTSDDSAYQEPVLVAPGSVASLSLFWGSNWCTDPVANDRIRVSLDSGSIEADGFGRSPICNGTTGSGPIPVSVDTFRPQSFREAEVTSAFGVVEGRLSATSDAVPGKELTFEVTLTARADVTLGTCPDFSMAQYAAGGDSVEARFALNCAAVPYHDAQGVPYLPGGVPVSFAMRWTLLGPDVQAV
jgi:hypothetical protein